MGTFTVGYDAAQLASFNAMPEWTPEFGALVVSGVAPSIDPESKPFPSKYVFFKEAGPNFAHACDIMAVWRMQQNPPATLSPTDFVAWCISEGVDLFWFRPAPLLQTNVLGPDGLSLVEAKVDWFKPTVRPLRPLTSQCPEVTRFPIPLHSRALSALRRGFYAFWSPLCRI